MSAAYPAWLATAEERASRLQKNRDNQRGGWGAPAGIAIAHSRPTEGALAGIAAAAFRGRSDAPAGVAIAVRD